MSGATSVSDMKVAVPTRRYGRWRRVVRDRRVRIGAALVIPVVMLTLLGPLAAPHAPTAFVAPPFSPRVPGSLFGTDNLGRDVFSRFLAGGRALLLLASVATLLGVFTGALLGSLTAYLRGFIDAVIMRVADVALAFPPIVLALMFVSLVGPKLWLIVLVVALGHVPRTLRVVRGAAMSIVTRDFVRYGESLGMPRRTVVSREILPNVVGPLMVELGIRFMYSIFVIAGLSFLGLGVQPPAPDWGNMINENRIGLAVQPWGVVLPLIALAVLAVGCNLITDGIARVVGAIDGGEPR